MRDRKEDIPELVRKFMRDFNHDLEKIRAQENLKTESRRKIQGKSPAKKGEEPENLQLSRDALELLRKEDFAGGNVRELRNILQSSIMMSGKISGIIQKQDVEKAIRFSKGDFSYGESGKSELFKILKKDPLEYFRRTKDMKMWQRTVQTGLEEEDLKFLEKEGLEKVLKEEKGSVKQLAEKISISRQVLHDRIKKYGINIKS